MTIKKVSILGVISILFIQIFLSSCTSNQVASLNADEFEKQLTAVAEAQLIDVRTPREFEKYRIANAKNMDFNKPEFDEEMEKLDKNKPVLIYCLSGVRSKSAAERFREAGFKTVYNLDGGINAWSKAEKPMEQDLSGVGEITSQDYEDIISTKGYVLVDYYAPWCGPCKKMLPMVNDLAEAYPGQFTLLTINFDDNRLLAKEQKITNVPYLAVFKDGIKIWDKSDEASRDELMKILELKER